MAKKKAKKKLKKGLWTKSELALLKKMFGNNPTAKISARLGRPNDAVKKKASRMGLRTIPGPVRVLTLSVSTLAPHFPAMHARIGLCWHVSMYTSAIFNCRYFGPPWGICRYPAACYFGSARQLLAADALLEF